MSVVHDTQVVSGDEGSDYTVTLANNCGSKSNRRTYSFKTKKHLKETSFTTPEGNIETSNKEPKTCKRKMPPRQATLSSDRDTSSITKDNAVADYYRSFESGSGSDSSSNKVTFNRIPCEVIVHANSEATSDGATVRSKCLTYHDKNRCASDSDNRERLDQESSPRRIMKSIASKLEYSKFNASVRYEQKGGSSRKLESKRFKHRMKKEHRKSVKLGKNAVISGSKCKLKYDLEDDDTDENVNIPRKEQNRNFEILIEDSDVVACGDNATGDCYKSTKINLSTSNECDKPAGSNGDSVACKARHKFQLLGQGRICEESEDSFDSNDQGCGSSSAEGSQAGNQFDLRSRFKSVDSDQDERTSLIDAPRLCSTSSARRKMDKFPLIKTGNEDSENNESSSKEEDSGNDCKGDAILDGEVSSYVNEDIPIHLIPVTRSGVSRVDAVETLNPNIKR